MPTSYLKENTHVFPNLIFFTATILLLLVSVTKCHFLFVSPVITLTHFIPFFSHCFKNCSVVLCSLFLLHSKKVQFIQIFKEKMHLFLQQDFHHHLSLKLCWLAEVSYVPLFFFSSCSCSFLTLFKEWPLKPKTALVHTDICCRLFWNWDLCC